MVSRSKGSLFPFALFRIVGGVYIGFVGGLSESGNVKEPLVVAYAAGPGASAVGALAVDQVQCIHIVEYIVAVTGYFPVNQVF